MNRLILCLLFSLAVSTAFSQRVYFVYLQTEQEQPFFVKLNEHIYSSTSSGYLILSKLHDSTYSFKVGFPQNKWPEQNFSVAIKSKDHGFLIKNFGDKGWGLFDLQTLSVQMATMASASIDPAKPENKDVSLFTEILSKAADDPSLKDKPVQIPVIEEKKQETVVQQAVKKEEVKKEEAKIDPPVIKKEEAKTEIKDTALAKTPDPVSTKTIKKEDAKAETIQTPIAKKEEVKEQPEEVYKRSVVTKHFGKSTADGLGLLFVDEYPNGKKDTIRIIIPDPKPAVTVKKEEPKEEKKFLDISSDTTQKAETPPVKAGLKNNCLVQAEQADFFKLRKQMAGIASEDEMVNEARKYFKKKCFTTAQVKNLSSMFLEEAGKYKFFDAVYPYVSDPENYPGLQSELKEAYYINRFKAMLK